MPDRAAHALFELADAVLCTEGPVQSLVGLSLAPEHRRGHGALYDGINHGVLDIARARNLVATPRLPKTAAGLIMLAVDVTPWLRPDANTAPSRSFCHTYDRGKHQHLMVPGWPSSICQPRTSWRRSPTLPVRFGQYTDLRLYGAPTSEPLQPLHFSAAHHC